MRSFTYFVAFVFIIIADFSISHDKFSAYQYAMTMLLMGIFCVLASIRESIVDKLDRIDCSIGNIEDHIT